MGSPAIARLDRANARGLFATRAKATCARSPGSHDSVPVTHTVGLGSRPRTPVKVRDGELTPEQREVLVSLRSLSTGDALAPRIQEIYPV